MTDCQHIDTYITSMDSYPPIHTEWCADCRETIPHKCRECGPDAAPPPEVMEASRKKNR